MPGLCYRGSVIAVWIFACFIAGERLRRAFGADVLLILSSPLTGERTKYMITLSELRSMTETAPLTKDKGAPGWRELRRNGGGVVETATLSNGSFIDIYAKGYVHYCRGERWTTFSLTDTTLDYRYGSVAAPPLQPPVIRAEYFSSLPWIIRVLMEGEDRVEYNISRTRTERNKAPILSTFDDYGTFGKDDEAALAILLKKELAEMLYKSFLMISARQQQVIEECVMEGRKNKEVSKELKLTHQAVSDALKRGLRNLRNSFVMIYGEPVSSGNTGRKKK